MGVMPPVNSAATLIMDPLVARNLKENEGFETKEDFSRWLSQEYQDAGGAVLGDRPYRHAGGLSGLQGRRTLCLMEESSRTMS